jgi:hypothetical protein
MFNAAHNFNGAISSWNTAALTTTKEMFWDAGMFDQNVGSWNMTQVTDLSNMFNWSALSPANYDSLLIGWSSQTLQSGKSLGIGNFASYSPAALAARNVLTGTYGWTIADGGLY